MRVTVCSVGRLRTPYLDDVAHYEKLLSRYVRLELIEVREEPQLPRRVPAEAYTSLLHVEGEAFTSGSFAVWLEARRASGRDLCFVLGGAFGRDELPGGVDHRFSLGPLTLPHQLARVVLLEQLFRGHKILAGEPYHH